MAGGGRRINIRPVRGFAAIYKRYARQVPAIKRTMHTFNEVKRKSHRNGFLLACGIISSRGDGSIYVSATWHQMCCSSTSKKKICSHWCTSALMMI